MKIMNRRMISLLLMMVFIVFVHKSLVAEDEISGTERSNATEQNLWWINLGVGFGRVSTFENTDDQYSNILATSMTLGYTYCWRSTGIILSGRFNHLKVGDEETVTDLGSLVGIAFKWRWGYFSISTGASLIYVSGGQHYTAGLPAQCEIFFTPFRGFGIGLIPYANLNNVTPFWGVNICVQFGRLYN